MIRVLTTARHAGEQLFYQVTELILFRRTQQCERAAHNRAPSIENGPHVPSPLGGQVHGHRAAVPPRFSLHGAFPLEPIQQSDSAAMR